MNPKEEGRSITLWHRAAAAAGASIVSAIVVNPLDVVKTRIQAQGAMADNFSLLTKQQPTLLEKWNFAGCGPTCIRIINPSSICGPSCQPVTYRGTFHALQTIARTEGPAVLWRGTNMALMMAIPMVGIYLPMYDMLLDAAHTHNAGPYAPLLAGMVARTAAVFCTAPFELARTRLQAMKPTMHQHVSLLATTTTNTNIASTTSTAIATAALHHHTVNNNNTSNTSNNNKSCSTNNIIKNNKIKLRAVSSMWTGVGATLARDVPFSGLYWAFVEALRPTLLPYDGPNSQVDVFRANVIAGGVSGGLAGAITTPLDVVKTRTQLSMSEQPLSMVGMMRGIVVKDGVGGLFQGWSARSVKAAPACAIVLSAYEMLKYMYGGE